ncbi:MAG: COQ9 family protein, partial [Pseudomonadota bacterium]
MTQTEQTDPEMGAATMEDTRARVLAAALPNVVFDGWTDKTLAEAVEDAGVDPGLARLAFPRGGVDLALAFHQSCDARLLEMMEAEDMSALRYSEKVSRAIELRLEMLEDHREAVRRAVALFALPIHAA